MGSKDNKNKNKNKLSGDSSNLRQPPPSNHKIIDDPRFASVHSDPRFRKVPHYKSKVSIDSRFNRIFTDNAFAPSSAPLDKRGKPKKQSSAANHLLRYYQISQQEKEKNKNKRGKKGKAAEEEDEEEESGSERLESSSEEDEESGSEAEESSTDEEEVDYDEDMPEVEVENIPAIEDSTRRLAVVNMDWRHVRAVDLYVVLSSFLPKNGRILSVAVYPSEFGIQRMKEEEVKGPVGLFDDKNCKTVDEDEDEDKDEDEEEDGIDDEKLRAYEKSRLRYYYAVVECDTVATADHLYKSCDGVEFERSSNVLDLRFIPDSMEFKYSPCDVATETPTSYEGLDFHTKALQHSSIPLSWDEDEPQRVKTLKRKFNADQIAELELNEYLASDQSETDDDGNDDSTEDQLDKNQKKRDKYRALIQSGDGSDEDEEEDGQDMEVTFNSGLEDLSKRILEKKDKKSETVWEARLRKMREKKKARRNKSKNSSEDESSDTDNEGIEEPDDFFVEEPPVKKSSGKKNAKGKSDVKEKQLQDSTDGEAEASKAELELLLADDKGANDGVKGYKFKPTKAKGKRGKEVPDESKLPTVDLDDPRFSVMLTSPLFALDPTDPQFKRSAAYARQAAMKRQKYEREEVLEARCEKQPTKDLLLSDEGEMNKDELKNSDVLPAKKEKHEISTLVKSIKMKAKQVQLPSQGKVRKKDRNCEAEV